MTALPDPLQHWAPELEGLSDTSLAAFAPWLPRLAAALGPFVDARADGTEEPEGFDGIANKGRYERLLISEWLLAEEAPLEFMRRAAMGRQLFTKLARKQPAQSRCCVVLLDAGPAQLGAPRLAQLAALIVLARRAREASARLVWGIVQGPTQLREGFDQAGVLALIAARTWTPVDREQLEAWRDHLRAIDLQADERWLLSDPSAAAAARSSGPWATLWITEPLPRPGDGFARTLALEVHDNARSRPPRSLALALPEDQRAVVIFREPFRRAPPVVAPIERRRFAQWTFPVPRRIWIDQAGRRIFARTPEGAVFGFHIPSSPNEEPGHPRLVTPRPDASILAVTARGRRMISLSVEQGQLVLDSAHKSNQTTLTTRHSTLAGLVRSLRGDETLMFDQHGYLLHTQAGQLWRLRASEEGLECQVLVEQGAGAIALNSSLTLLAVNHPGGPRICSVSATETRQLSAGDPGAEIVGFGWGLLGSHPPLLCRRSDGGYFVKWEGPDCAVDPPGPGERIIGTTLTNNSREVPMPGLLLIDASRRKIVHTGQDAAVVLKSFAAPISAATLGSSRGLVVAWTEDQQLWVYDLISSRTLMNMRVLAGESPA